MRFLRSAIFRPSALAMRRSLLALLAGTGLAGLVLLASMLLDGSQRMTSGFGMLVLCLAFVASMFVISVAALGRQSATSWPR